MLNRPTGSVLLGLVLILAIACGAVVPAPVTAGGPQLADGLPLRVDAVRAQPALAWASAPGAGHTGWLTAWSCERAAVPPREAKPQRRHASGTPAGFSAVAVLVPLRI